MASLVSLSDYKTIANISGTADDARLTIILSAASTFFRRWCGRNEDTGFNTATWTEFYDGTGEESIQLREWPITSITSAQLVDDAGALTTLASTDYRVNLKTGVLSMLGTTLGRKWVEAGVNGIPTTNFEPSPQWPEGIQNVKVIYVGGYSTIPSDIQLVVCQMVDTSLAQAGGNRGMQSESIGQYSYSRAKWQDVLDANALMIAPYRTGGV